MTLIGRFAIEDKFVRILGDDGQVDVRLKPLGVDATDLAEISANGSPAAAVLLDGGAEGGRGWDNIVAIDVRGSILWSAKRPGYNTSAPYRYIYLKGGCMYAYADSGFEVRLNSDTGEIENADFSK